MEAGSGSSIREGALVIPACAEMGTWRQYAMVEEREVLPIPPGLSLGQAATALVNPPTAYRMLHDFQVQHDLLGSGRYNVAYWRNWCQGMWSCRTARTQLSEKPSSKSLPSSAS